MLQFGIILLIDLRQTKDSVEMNFKCLLEQYGFEDIFPDFMELWKINAPKSAEHLDKDGWKKSYWKSHIMAIMEKCLMRIGNLYSIKTEINSDNISFFLVIPQFGILAFIYLSV